MTFEFSEKTKEWQRRLLAFMDQHIYPNEPRYYAEIERNHWQPSRIIEELKPKARGAGLWNLFWADHEHGAGLTNLEYAPLCEIMGRSAMAPEVFNCAAPDTGNMEVLARYGTPEQKERWLKPLLAGEIRSCFAMTEPSVASSDATNISARIVREEDEYLIKGRQWWATGVAERALELMCKRVQSRVAFGKTLAEQGTIRADIAKSRMEIDQARLLTLKAAHMMDTVGNKAARTEIAMIKVVAPNVTLRVLDRAIQAHGGAGVSEDTFLASAWANVRTLRLADGPDEVHTESIAKWELGKWSKPRKQSTTHS